MPKMGHLSPRTLLLAISLLWCGSAEAIVVGAGVLPHGDLALEPALLSFTNNTAELNAACVRVRWRMFVFALFCY